MGLHPCRRHSQQRTQGTLSLPKRIEQHNRDLCFLRATKRSAETQLTPNSVEGYIGGLRSFDGHQAEPTHLLAIEATKDDFSVDTIGDESRR